MSSTTTDAGLKKQKRPAMEENAGEKLKPGKGKSGSKTAKAQAQNGTGIGAAATSAANGNKSNRVGPVNGGVQQAPSSNRPFGAQTATKRSTMTLAEALFKNAGIPMPSTLQLLARVRNDANKASPNQIPSPNPVPPIKRNKIQADTPNSSSPSIDANVGNCNDGNGGMSASQSKQKNKSANVGAVSESEKSLAKKNSVEKGKEKENGGEITKQRELQSKSLPIIAPKSAQKKPEAAKKPSCPVESPAVSVASTVNLTALSVPTVAINESILGKSPSRQEARTATPVAIVAPMTANKPVPETVAAVESDKEPEKGQPDVVGLKGAKEMAEMATRTLVLILRPEVSVPTETNTTSWQFYAQWLQRSFQLKAESVIETSKPFLLHGLYYIVYVILDSTKTHDSVLEVYEKNPENYQCFISSGSVMLKEGSEEVRKNKCADAEGQPQQQPLQTDSNSNSKSDEVALVECLELLLIDKPSDDNSIGSGAMDKTTTAQSSSKGAVKTNSSAVAKITHPPRQQDQTDAATKQLSAPVDYYSTRSTKNGQQVEETDVAIEKDAQVVTETPILSELLSTEPLVDLGANVGGYIQEMVASAAQSINTNAMSYTLPPPPPPPMLTAPTPIITAGCSSFQSNVNDIDNSIFGSQQQQISTPVEPPPCPPFMGGTTALPNPFNNDATINTFSGILATPPCQPPMANNPASYHLANQPQSPMTNYLPSPSLPFGVTTPNNFIYPPTPSPSQPYYPQPYMSGWQNNDFNNNPFGPNRFVPAPPFYPQQQHPYRQVSPAPMGSAPAGGTMAPPPLFPFTVGNFSPHQPTFANNFCFGGTPR